MSKKLKGRDDLIMLAGEMLSLGYTVTQILDEFESDDEVDREALKEFKKLWHI